MATYKVIQDIEAEDKLVGPLTLRQFIYAGISAVSLYICFLFYTKHAQLLIGLFLPVAAVSGFFAFPWKGEQPTEIWALARLRFMLKPRVRVWNQSGVKEVVKITAPRKLEVRRPLTNNLSEIEVRSRLKALADTIDSRGWATRNAAYGIYGQQQSQIVAPGQLPVVGGSINDMFDDRGSTAQNFDAMLARSSQSQRQRVMQQMTQAPAPVAPPQMRMQVQQTPMQQMQQPQPQQTYAPQMGANQPYPSLPAPVMPRQQMPANMVMNAPPVANQMPTPVAQAMQAIAPQPPSATEQDYNAILKAAKVGKPQTGNAPENDFWFASNTANPTTAAPAPMAPASTLPMQPQMMQSVTPAPSLPMPTGAIPMQGVVPVSQVATPAPAAPPTSPVPASNVSSLPVVPAAPATSTAPASALSASYMEALSSGKIMTDVPVAAALNPTNEELAFAEQLKQNRQAQEGNSQTIPAFDPSQAQFQAAPQPAASQATGMPPSVPGMIDYGRPQPIDDQMQYDTSRSPAAANQPAIQAAQPVTRTPNPAILDLANNDDLDIATLARQAKGSAASSIASGDQNGQKRQTSKPGGEVEVRLR